MEQQVQKLGFRDSLRLLGTFLNGKIALVFAANMALMLVVGVFPAIVTETQIRLFDGIGSGLLSLGGLFALAIAYSVVRIASRVARFFFQKCNYVFSEKMKMEFQKQIFQKMGRVKLEEFEDPSFHDLLQRVRWNGSGNVIGALTNWFDLARSILNIVSISLVVGQIHWIFPVLTIPLSIPSLIVSRKMNFNYYFQEMDNSTRTRKNHYIIDILHRREYAAELRVFGLFQYFYDYHVRMRDYLFEETYRLVKKYTIYAGIIGICGKVVQVACCALGIYFVSVGRMDIGQFAVLCETIVQIQGALDDVVNCYKNQNSQQYHLEDIARFQGLGEESASAPSAPQEKADLHVEGLSFTYPFGEDVVLKDLSLDIPFGQKVAIVGENGSGKTTFANLLAGLYQPTKGQILAGGQDVALLLPKWRDSVGYIFQDFIQLKGSVRENVELGASDDVPKERVQEVLEESGAWDFVGQLPQKEETALGFLQEGSMDLSGGQWQKLAIARALLDEKREILILDEFAASLDAFSEAELYERFQQMTEGKTTISISHRLGITQFVDRILVFQDGRIVEDGTHEELMRKHGHYYEMYCAQRGLYQ